MTCKECSENELVENGVLWHICDFILEKNFSHHEILDMQNIPTKEKLLGITIGKFKGYNV